LLPLVLKFGSHVHSLPLPLEARYPLLARKRKEVVDGRPQRILAARRLAFTQGAMRRSIVFAFVLSIGPVWLPTASPASDKKHDPESVLVSIEGCLKMSATEYVIIDDTGTQRNLIGGTAKLKHYVGRRVQIIGEPTTKAFDATEAGIASSAVEVPAIRVQSGRKIGGKCGLYR